MTYKRITHDEYEIQSYCDKSTGWECVCGCEDFRDARDRLKEYRANEILVPHRIKKIRVPNNSDQV